jgi:hypothetical protein
MADYLNDLPDTRVFALCGEDMHLSYTAQKYGKIKTFVPPHPKTDLELWGSDPQKGMQYGTEAHAISLTMPFSKFTEPFRRLLDLGFLTIANKAAGKE